MNEEIRKYAYDSLWILKNRNERHVNPLEQYILHLEAALSTEQVRANQLAQELADCQKMRASTELLPAIVAPVIEKQAVTEVPPVTQEATPGTLVTDTAPKKPFWWPFR